MRQNKYKPLIARLGTTLLASNAPSLLFFRVRMSIILGVLTGGIARFTKMTKSTIISIIICLVVMFEMSSEYGYGCKKYLQELPTHEILVPSDRNNLIISDEPRKIGIFVPLTESKMIMDTINSPKINSNKKEKVVQQKFVKSRKKAKMVKLYDFRRKDPVLSKYLDEPQVPQKRPPEGIAETGY